MSLGEGEHFMPVLEKSCAAGQRGRLAMLEDVYPKGLHCSGAKFTSKQELGPPGNDVTSIHSTYYSYLTKEVISLDPLKLPK